EEALYAGLKKCRAMIALCSANWQQSRWCFAELVFAKAMRKEVFPVLFEPCELGEVAGEHQGILVYEEGEAAYARLWAALERLRLGPLDASGWNPEERSLSREVLTAFGSAIAAAREWQSGFLG